MSLSEFEKRRMMHDFPLYDYPCEGIREVDWDLIFCGDRLMYTSLRNEELDWDAVTATLAALRNT